MPPKTLPIDLKELSTERKPSSSEPIDGVFPARLREPPTTPSSHPNESPLSCHGPVSDIRRSFSVGGQKDWRRVNYWETATATQLNSSHSHYVNSMDNLQSNDQHAKNSSGQRLEKEGSLGSSLDWKPLKWTRSGSLCSRGSLDSKIEGQTGNSGPVQSTSGDTGPSLTPRTSDDATSRKKARLGWGEGLAKYEKKKIDPVQSTSDDFVDKEAGVRDASADGVSSSEQMLSSPSSLLGKSPTLPGVSDCVTPTTCAVACSSSPDLKEKTSIAPVTVDNDACNPTVVSCHLSQNHTFNLENLENTKGFNLSSSLDELLQNGNTGGPGSSFAMDKLQVWKADISRTLEITETEIDSLENELKSLVSDVKEDLKEDTPGTSTSKFVDMNITSEKAECSQDHVSDDMLGVVAGSSRTTYREDNKSYDSIFAANKAVAKTSDELIKILLPTTQLCTNNFRATNESLIKKRFATWKRSLKVKERITTLKFLTLQYSWKKDLNTLSVKSAGAKLHKKFESSSRMGYADHQKHRVSTHSRLSSSGGSLKLAPTTDMVKYAKKLLSDSRLRIYRKVLKMPSLMLDRGERLTSMFSSNNGLVENPVDVEKEKAIINPWTEQDKKLFLEKYSLLGKNFRKIASFFQHKTVADCVEFYYKNHKSDLFSKTKKKPEFAKRKSYTTNMYLVTFEKQRLNREIWATSSLDMLGSASEMVSNQGSSDRKLENLNDLSVYCNEQEAAAADVLAGICGSISSEALGSCITSSVDQSRICKKLGNGSLNDVDGETCSDDSCEEETNSCVWTDEEKSLFVKAVKCYGKDFSMISRCVKTRSSDQCRLFFSKARKCLGLDAIVAGSGSEGTTGANQGGGSGSDDACMVDSGSVISNDKSSGEECKMEELEDLHSSDSKKELVELSHGSETEVKLEERSLNVNMEGAADSEATEAAANPEESPPNTHSDSASGAKVEPAKTCKEETRESESQLPSFCPVEDLNSASFYSRSLSVDHGTNLDLNADLENVSSQEQSNRFVMSNLFPKRRTLSQDDASSRLLFRKGGQRSLSTDGYNSHLPKCSLIDCAESSQILRGCPVRASVHSNFKLDEHLLMDPCMPRDGSNLKTCIVSQEQRRSSSLDVEKPSLGGDFKLFGQILTNNSSNKLQQPLPKEFEKPNSGMPISLKCEQNNLQLRSHGFWDGNKLQTVFSSSPDSALLLAKYPTAFQTPSNLKTGNNLNVLTGFPTRKLSSNNGGANYHIYGRQEAVPPFIEPLSGIQQQGRGMNVVSSEACNGVSDPVTAIQLHYARSQQYKNNSGGVAGDNWISKAANDIGS